MKKTLVVSLAMLLLLAASSLCLAESVKTEKAQKKKTVQLPTTKKPVIAPALRIPQEKVYPAAPPAASPKLLAAEKAAEPKELKVGATIYFRWQKYLQNGGSAVNNFDLDRAYIDFRKEMDKGATGRLTLDISRIPGASKQNLFDYIKYAYVEMPLGMTNLKLGLQQTVWIDWADKLLNLRWIAKSLIDNEGVMSSADFGAGFSGKIMIAGWPGMEYQVTATNGTGYATNEADSKKAIAARLSSVLLNDQTRGKIIAGAFGNLEGADGSASLAGNKQAGAALSYELGKGVLAAEYVYGSKNDKRVSGYSVGGTLNLDDWLSNYRAFARIDHYDPDAGVNGNEKGRSFYGIIYDWSRDLKLAADVQNSQTGSGQVTSIFYFHVLAQL